MSDKLTKRSRANYWISVLGTVFGVLCLLLGTASPVRAGEFCSGEPFYGVVDGDAGYVIPTQITIDTDCTFQNFPQSDPLTATLNFQTNDPSTYLIVFDNVTFTGNMACANIDHKIWFANGADYGSNNSCQPLFIPVETIDKQSPAATATIGVPFTYTLTLPSFQFSGDPSNNDLHTVILWDDISRAATGADLTFVDINAHWKGSGAAVTLVPEDDPLAKGGMWTTKNLSYKPIPLISAGEQVVVEITVVLDDTPGNAAGTQFANTAKWWFGRAIDVDDDGAISYPDEFFEPLPGEWGISQPMTIAEPDLVVTKASDTTTLNLVGSATFTIDVENVGGSDAWNATILDQLPDLAGVTGMCPVTAPSIGVQVLAADGITPISGPLVEGVDYSLTYSGEPACQLGLALFDTPAAKIGPSQHLIVTYDLPLDADTDPAADGIALTNLAAVTEWFNGNSSIAGSRNYGGGPGSLTDGTPGVLDFQDSATVTTALSGYYFQKTVENRTSGQNQATTATSGDTLRYRLRLFNITEVINGVTISDTLDASRFDLTTFSMVSDLAAEDAVYSFNPVTGLLQVSGSPAPLDLVPPDELVVEFDITLKTSLTNGSTVENQASLSANAGSLTANSDDPYINGVASPGDPADPTTVLIETPGPLTKTISQASAAIGEQFTYRITVPEVPSAVPLYDVRVVDELGLSAADMTFVSASVVSGGLWSLSNTGTATSLVLEDTSTGIDIPAGEQVAIEIAVELDNATSNNNGLSFNNSASYTYNRMNGNAATQTNGGEGTSAIMNVVEPLLTTSKAVSFVTPAGKLSSDPAQVGDVLEYAVTMTNRGNSTAFDTNVVDTLPANVSLVPGAATARINGIDVTGFVSDPTTLTRGVLAWGRQNGDESLDIPVGQSLVLTYRVTVVSVTGADIENRVSVAWTSLNGASAVERTGSGSPAQNDYFTGPASATVNTIDNTFIEKVHVEDSFAETPASTAVPVVRVGDTVTYELRLSLQEYTTRNVVVEDQLPQGMALESFTIDAGANFSYPLDGTPTAGDAGILRWEFGDINNTPSGDGTPIDPLVIQYVAMVVTDPPPVGVTYEASITRDNLARLSYTGGDPDVYPGRLTATETIEVRQPQMSAISKVDLGSGRIGSGTLADPFQVNLATDVMNFRLSTCNNGLAPAYGVAMTDMLAPEFDEGDLASNPPVVKIDATTLSAGIDYTFTAPDGGGEMLIALLDGAPVNPGECVTVDYNVGFRNDLTTQTTWSNQARLSEYRSHPAGGRLYAPTATAQLWMTNLVNDEALVKRVVSTTGEVTIGEEVTYEITVPGAPLNIALDNVVVNDPLHGALEYVSDAVTLNGTLLPISPSQTGQDLSWALGTIPAGQQAVITVTVRVANDAQAEAGTSFTNTASYTFTGKPADLVTSGTSGAVTIVEPSVSIAKSVVNVTNPGAAPNVGDVLRYSVQLTASGGAAGDDFSNAFDLAIEDSLGLGLAYQDGTASVDGPGNAIADPFVAGDGSTTAQTLTWSLADANADIDVTEGAVVTVTYDVVVLNGVLPGQELANSATARWTGLDGDSALERTGSGTPMENDYLTGPATTSLRAEFAISFVKSVVNATTGEDPGDNAVPGNTLRYSLVLTNESIAPVNNASLLDELAAQFAPGTLQNLIVSDPSADTSNSNASGGGNGTGIVDIRNLSLAAQGNPGDTVIIEFVATLAATIPNGTEVLNQAQLTAANLPPTRSNQTSTSINSEPSFQVLKSSQDLTGDTSVLMAGDVLRYTISVKNVGNENATGVTLRDLIPANTTYVANSTQLNGTPVADSIAGVSPLESGLLVNAPEDTTPGMIRADADPDSSSNVATITFEVLTNSNVVDGTLITNQGFVSGLGAGGPFPEQPSNTTQDVVGNLPLIDVQKTVAIQTDLNGNGVADPGDVLLYTIRIDNCGATPTTGVRLTDTVPAETIYEINSVRLNDQPVTNNGALPLLDILVHSPDQAPGSGVVSAGSSATVTFAAEVDNVAAGMLISNQGDVASNELPTEPTDADGDPSNGNQPTLIYVGDAQELAITKEYQVVGGGPAAPGATVEYMIRVTNIGTTLAQSVVISDSLAPPLGDQVSYVAGSALLNGVRDGVSFDGTTLTATQGDLSVGSSAVLRLRVQINTDQVLGTQVANIAAVQWNMPPRNASAEVIFIVGSDPVQGRLNGAIWHDANFNDLLDSSESPLAGWSVEMYRNARYIGSTVTDANGAYTLSGLTPNEGTGDTYGVRFLAPGAGANSALMGMANSVFTDGLQSIDDIIVGSGSNLLNLNLPIAPNGVVFNTVARTPVAGATVSMLHDGVPVDSSCFDDTAQQNQVTLASGYYKFDLNFGDSNPLCPPTGSVYEIQVTPPASGYVSMPSQIIPPNGEPIAPFSVSDCPGSAVDAVPTTAEYCEASPYSSVPPLSVPARTSGTVYHLHLTLSNAVVPGGSQIFNNNIPVDPELDGAVAISKTSPLINVSKGDLVPYTITVDNVFGVPLFDVGIIDRFPAGFKYVQGSARMNGEPHEPTIDGRQLLWDGLSLNVNESRTIKLLLVVGAGVAEGEYVNRAQVISTISGGAASGEATATVRVVADPTFDCTDVIGKVFDDRNLNGQQDDDEPGLAGTRVVTARGLIATTDEYGRFHISCATVPDEDRGSNFILKLDDRSLPTGYRVITENPRIQRATRGKMLKFNFGATIHRVVAIDIADGVFEPDTAELRLQWVPKFDQLLEVLEESPAVLHLSYLADVEDERLVHKRLKSLKDEIAERWNRSDADYRLTIETEIFWRRGGPL